MSDDESDFSLLNIYEVESDEGTRHLVGFQDPGLAGSVGIASHAMLGEFTPDPHGEFDPETFVLNPEFIESVTQYMNAEPARTPGVAEHARQIPGDWLYVVDPRNTSESDDEPPAEDVLGRFA